MRLRRRRQHRRRRIAGRQEARARAIGTPGCFLKGPARSIGWAFSSHPWDDGAAQRETGRSTLQQAIVRSPRVTCLARLPWGWITRRRSCPQDVCALFRIQAVPQVARPFMSRANSRILPARRDAIPSHVRRVSAGCNYPAAAGRHDVPATRPWTRGPMARRTRRTRRNPRDPARTGPPVPGIGGRDHHWGRRRTPQMRSFADEDDGRALHRRVVAPLVCEVISRPIHMSWWVRGVGWRAMGTGVQRPRS
jgi:hypothetical protein